MTLRTALELGRVSNLPTVWSNVIAGIVLAGVEPRLATVLLLCVAGSLFYTGGMFLNDYFDRDSDAATRPERPIPSGAAGAVTVRSAGFALLAAAAAVAALAARPYANVRPTLFAAGALAALIVLYDFSHKKNPTGPVVMGLCRVMLYVTASCAVVGAINPTVATGAALLFFYLIGLTYAAKMEDAPRPMASWPLVCLGVAPLWFAAAASGALGSIPAATAPAPTAPPPDFGYIVPVWGLVACFAAVTVMTTRRLLSQGKPSVGASIAVFVAAIALLDACSIALTGRPGLAMATAALCPLTLALQRFVRGT